MTQTIDDNIHSSGPLFPCKMYAMLEDAEAKGFETVISWQPEGKAFKIYRPEIFASTLMQTYFAQTKFKSFQRQLNIYGWKMVQFGPNKGGYAHKYFVRGSPDLCKNIIRRATPPKKSDAQLGGSPKPLQIKGELLVLSTGAGSASKNVPPTLARRYNHKELRGLIESEMRTFCNLFNMNNRWREEEDACHDNDRLVNNTKCRVTSFTSAARRVDDPEPNGDLEECTATGGNTSFPVKVHVMLENAEKDNYADIVSWVNGGTAFKVHKQDEFLKRVMPVYFDQSKYESFRRQLNMYHFSRVARGSDRGVISHPFLVAGSPGLCHKITRNPTLVPLTAP